MPLKVLWKFLQWLLSPNGLERQHSPPSEPVNLARRQSLVAMRGRVKLQIYAEEGKHKRPHFHIRYKNEFAASYAIDDLSLLAGYLPKRFEKPLLKWAARNQRRLMVAWHQVNSGAPPVAIDIEQGGDE